MEKDRIMKTYIFSTTLKCGGCVTAITPALENDPEIVHWEVDLTHAERRLTIETNYDPETIISKLAEKGYKAQLVG
jgi:copper chaperone